jgi:hypothetical protein
MGKTTRLWLAVGVLLIPAAGCDLVTDPEPLEEFVYEAVEDPAGVEEGVEVVEFFGEVQVLGQILTPTLCYRMDGEFDQKGSTMTLQVNATSTNSINCSQHPGGFHYTAVLRHLKSGTYTLKIIHKLPGQTAKEYTRTVTI